MFDEDIKIASLGNNKPKKDEYTLVLDEYTRETAKGNTEKAKEIAFNAINLAEEDINNYECNLILEKGKMIYFGVETDDDLSLPAEGVYNKEQLSAPTVSKRTV